MTVGSGPGDAVAAPAAFRAMPRWWREGTAWLDDLPRLVARQCRAWGLTIDGATAHGSNALVVPVCRAGQPFALRLSPPSDDVAGEAAALRFWDGRGTVRLVACDRAANALLLERLDAHRTLATEPLVAAVPTIARLLRATAVRPSPRATSTAAIVRRRIPARGREWPALGAPGGEQLLRSVLAAARALPAPAHPTAVHGDLHYAQVLAGDAPPGSWSIRCGAPAIAATPSRRSSRPASMRCRRRPASGAGSRSSRGRRTSTRRRRGGGRSSAPPAIWPGGGGTGSPRTRRAACGSCGPSPDGATRACLGARRRRRDTARCGAIPPAGQRRRTAPR